MSQLRVKERTYVYVRRRLVRVAMLAALAMLLVPSLAQARHDRDRESPRERMCEQNPNRPGCDRVLERQREQEAREKAAACTSAKKQAAAAKKRLKKAKKALKKANKKVKKAKGQKPKAKAKKARKRARKKVKKAKKAVKAGNALVKARC